MRIDHVIVGARRLAEARELLWSAYGLGITDGTSNEDGTDSWLVPFDCPDVQYLELIVATDEPVLRSTEYGRSFLDRTAAGPTFVAWAVAVDDIDGAAERVGRLGADPDPQHGESVRADGERMPWSEAAFLAAWATPSRPFFLRYGNWPARRARVARDLAAAGHRCTPRAIRRVHVSTARHDLTDWLGGSPGFVAIHASDCEGIDAVTLDTDGGEVELRLPRHTAAVA